MTFIYPEMVVMVVAGLASTVAVYLNLFFTPEKICAACGL